MKQKYLLTMKIDFESIDDVEAREKLSKLSKVLERFEEVFGVETNPLWKLQQVFQDKAPRSVNIK